MIDPIPKALKQEAYKSVLLDLPVHIKNKISIANKLPPRYFSSSKKIILRNPEFSSRRSRFLAAGKC